MTMYHVIFQTADDDYRRLSSSPNLKDAWHEYCRCSFEAVADDSSKYSGGELFLINDKGEMVTQDDINENVLEEN